MEQVIAETMLSEKGKKLLIVNNYKFARASTSKSGKIRWKCCNAKCTARIYSLTYEEENVVEQKGDHNHPSDSTLSRQAVSNSLKRKAIYNAKRRPAELIHSELETNKFSHDIIKDDFKRFRQNMSRLRSKTKTVIFHNQVQVVGVARVEQAHNVQAVTVHQAPKIYSLTTEEEDVMEQKGDHNHPSDSTLSRQAVTNSLMMKAISDLTVQFTELIHSELESNKFSRYIIKDYFNRLNRCHLRNEIFPLCQEKSNLSDQEKHYKSESPPREEETDIAIPSNRDNQNSVIVETMLSEKGKKLLILNNYKFAKASTSKSGKIRWKCCNAKCTARIYSMTALEEHVVEQKGDHNHASDSTLSRQAVSNSLKRKAVVDLMVRPAKLIHSELETNKFSHNIIKDDIKRMRRNMCSARRKRLPFFNGVDLHQYYHKLLGVDSSCSTTQSQG